MNTTDPIKQEPPGHTGSESTPFQRRPSRQPLSSVQIQAVAGVADPELQGIIKIGRRIGQRLRMAAKLRWRDVDLERRIIRVFATQRGFSWEVTIPDDLFKYLSGMPKSSDPDSPLFPTYCALALENPALLNHKLRKLRARAGVSPCSFNSLRVTYVTSLRNAGFQRLL